MTARSAPRSQSRRSPHRGVALAVAVAIGLLGPLAPATAAQSMPAQSMPALSMPAQSMPAQSMPAEAQRLPRAGVASTPTIAEVVPGASALTYATVNGGLPGTPPDVALGVSGDFVVQLTNGEARITSRATGQLAQAAQSLDSWLAISGARTAVDPSILFDPATNRWFTVAFIVSTANLPGSTVQLRVSASADPTGAWRTYAYADSQRDLDYPQLGLTADKAVVTANAYGGVNKDVLEDVLLLSWPKLALAAGAPAAPGVTSLGTDSFGAVPAASSGGSTDGYLPYVSWTADAATGVQTSATAEVIVVSGSPGAPTISRVAAATRPMTNPTGVGVPTDPLAGSTLATQPDGRPLDPGDGRTLAAVAVAGRVWFTVPEVCAQQTQQTPTVCARVLGVPLNAGQTVAADVDTTFSLPGTHVWNQALTVSPDQVATLAFSWTTPVIAAPVGNGHPGVGVVTLDAAGTWSAPVLRAGAEAYVGTTNEITTRGFLRWGDFATATPDPASPGAVWIAQQWVETGAPFRWNWSTSVWRLTRAPAAVALSGPSTVLAGDTIPLATQVTSDGGPVGGVQVTLQQRPIGASQWSPTARTSTDAVGRATFAVRPRTGTDYRVDAVVLLAGAGWSTPIGVTGTSFPQRVTYAPRIVARGNPIKARAYTPLAVTGAIWPALPGTVTLQRKINGVWQTASSTIRLDSRGRYALTFSRPTGLWLWRVLLPRTASTLPVATAFSTLGN